MRRNGISAVKKSLTILTAAAVMMSDAAVAYADEKQTIPGVVAFADAGNDTITEEMVELTDDTGAETIGVAAVSMYGHEADVTIYDEDVTIEGDVTVEESGKDGTATGVLVSSEDKDSKSNVKIEGDVKSESKEGKAEGVNASAKDGASAEIDIGGKADVKADGDAWGLVAVGNGDEGEYKDIAIKTSVGGNVDADSENGEAYGSLNDLYKGSNIDISIGGNIDVEAGTVAYGIKTDGEEDTEFKVKVGGGINVNGSGMSGQGINIETAGKASVDVGKDVTSDGFGVMVAAIGGKENDVSIEVGGDVTAGFDAVLIIKDEDSSSIDLTVDGTIKGESHNIVFTTDTREEAKGKLTTKGVDITVWKIDTEKTEGVTAEIFDSGKYEDYSDKAAEFINYIIRVDDTTKLTPGVPDAKEGEKVFLEVNTPSGYSVDSFYTAKDGTKVDVVQDDSGKYYLVVPRGGGVFVGVTLKADTKSDSTNESDPTNENNPAGNADSREKSNSADTNNYSSSDDSDDSGKDANNSSQGGTFTDNTGRTSDINGRVSTPQSVMVNGQQVDANVSVSSAGEGMERAFADALGMLTTTGIVDLGGNIINMPADALIKDSFTFEATGLSGFVTTYMELTNYKAGDIIMCTYYDELGRPILVAITPEMVEGTGLILTIPANCILALAGV